MDIPRDKETGMTVQDYHTETLTEQNKSIMQLIKICTSLNQRAKVNLEEHDRLDKRMKSLEGFAMGLFMANSIVSLILIILLIVL